MVSLSKRQQAILELIKVNLISDQKQLIELLREKFAIQTNQTAISRDFQVLKVVKRKVADKWVYEAPEEDVNRKIFELGLVDIGHNESIIVIKTLPGLAAFVGDYLDRYPNLNILGTLAGENVVFVSPLTIKNISSLYTKLCQILYFGKKT